MSCIDTRGDARYSLVNTGKSPGVGRHPYLHLRSYFKGDRDTARGGEACLIRVVF